MHQSKIQSHFAPMPVTLQEKHCEVSYLKSQNEKHKTDFVPKDFNVWGSSQWIYKTSTSAQKLKKIHITYCR